MPWSTRDFLKGEGNFKVKGLAGVAIGGVTAIWSAHNNGRLLRYFGAMNRQPMGIEVVMPNEYLERCEPSAVNNRTLSDHRALAVRSRHDGFLLLESCAVLVWFDPDAPINEERVAASIFRGDEINQAWPRISTRIPQQILRFTENHVWVGWWPLLPSCFEAPALTSLRRKLTCIAGLACMSGCSDQKVVEIGGIGDAVVFAVHLDDEQRPISTSGPYRIDDGTSVTTVIPPDETGLSDDTQFVAFDLAKVEERTAALDDSVRRNLRFDRSSACWISSECEFELKLGLPSGGEIERRLGQSIGYREFVPTADLTTMPDSAELGWLSQLVLRAPFDQHLVEPTTLESFPEVRTWTSTLSQDFPGIRDYSPIDEDRVVIVVDKEACIIQRSTLANDICSPGPSTISASELTGVAGSIMTHVAQARDASGYLPRFYLVAQTGSETDLYSIDIDDEGFGDRRLLTSTVRPVLAIVVGHDGTVVMTLLPSRGESLQSILEFAPDGVQRPTTEIQWTLAADWVDELAATTNPQAPFIVTHGHNFALRQPGNAQEPWKVRSLPLTGDERAEGVAGIGGPGDLSVWVVRDLGLSTQIRETNSFSAEDVPWAMPDEYMELCELRQPDADNRPQSDLRALTIIGPNEGYALIKDCAVLVRFDPSAAADDLRTVSVVHTGFMSNKWPRVGGDFKPLTFQARNGVLWVGGGAALYNLQLPLN